MAFGKKCTFHAKIFLTGKVLQPHAGGIGISQRQPAVKGQREVACRGGSQVKADVHGLLCAVRQGHSGPAAGSQLGRGILQNVPLAVVGQPGGIVLVVQ